ncbi:MAG: ATP-binding protein [Acutalibacteraceae bacterium]|jgi:DNA replication protein DnaC
MGYDKAVYESAVAALGRRRAAAQAEAADFRRRMVARDPRLGEIEREIERVSTSIAPVILQGGDVAAAIERLKTDSLALQKEMADRLKALGADRADFQPRYACPRCEDTGFHDGNMCACLHTLLREGACEQLSRMAAMELTRLEDMRLDYYPDEFDPRLGQSPRQRMQGVLGYCRDYAAHFSPSSPSLLVSGPTGVGKTHAVLAIARAAVERGYGVIYGPAGVLLGRLEKEHFGRIEGDSEALFLDADLLVLDDLGTEFTGPFYTACLYDLINSRLLAGKPTIISTNLGRGELCERYGEQIASRVLGAYEPLAFFGRDIRQIRSAERHGM